MSSGAFDKKKQEKKLYFEKKWGWLWLFKFNHTEEFCKEKLLPLEKRAEAYALGWELGQPLLPLTWPVGAT